MDTVNFKSITTTAQVKLVNNSWKQSNLTGEEQANLDLALHFMNGGIGLGDLNVFDECVASDALIHTGLKPQGPISGLAEYKSIFAAFSDAWPVIEFIIDEAFATDDKVVIRFQAIAYFKKDYYGLKATNEIINMKEAHILTIRDGKITSNVVSGTNFPFEYFLYPLMKDAVIGNLPTYTGEQVIA